MPDAPEFACCSCPEPPADLRLEAAWHAACVRPENAPGLVDLAYTHPHDDVLPPGAITLVRSKFWPVGSVLKVAFRAGNLPASPMAEILQFMNLWSKYANISFVRWSQGQTPDIVVAFDRTGFWSYIGTDCRVMAARGETTMNLEGFDTGDMPISEYYRVICHETGHALGALHEQCRPEVVKRLDPAKTYAFMEQTQGWSEEMIDQQILTPLDMTGDILASPEEDTSIMMYQFPASITTDGAPIVGGSKITARDGRWMARAYPGRGEIHPHLAALGMPSSGDVC